MFVELRMGLADWEIDLPLRQALLKAEKSKQVMKLFNEYDETFELSISSNLQINKKYKHLYKLDSKQE